MSKKYRSLLVWAFVAVFALSLFLVPRIIRAEEIKDGDAPIAASADETENDESAPTEVKEGEVTLTEGEGGEDGEDTPSEGPIPKEGEPLIYAEAKGAETAAVGSTYTYNILVVNNAQDGYVLNNVQVVDELTGNVKTYDQLASGMNMIQGSYVVTEEDLEAGSFVIRVVATCDDVDEEFVKETVVTVTEASEEEPATEPSGEEAAPQQQGGAPQGPQANVPATGDASMLPAIVSAISGIATLAGAAFLRRRD